MFVIFIEDDSKHSYRARDIVTGKILAFESEYDALAYAEQLKASNSNIIATQVIFEGKRKKK
jgi:hypothetical protein